jgi:hypothetical protein
MIVEQRTYTLYPHIPIGTFLRPYEHIGLPAQKRILKGFMGYYTLEFGEQNRVTHFWAFDDLEDRKAKRAELMTDAQWQECISTVRPMIKTMQNDILYPTSFSPEPLVHPS